MVRVPGGKEGGRVGRERTERTKRVGASAQDLGPCSERMSALCWQGRSTEAALPLPLPLPQGAPVYGTDTALPQERLVWWRS